MLYKQLEILMRIYNIKIYDEDLYKTLSIDTIKFIFTNILGYTWKTVSTFDITNIFDVEINVANKKDTFIIIYKQGLFIELYPNLCFEDFIKYNKNSIKKVKHLKNEEITQYLLSLLKDL